MHQRAKSWSQQFRNLLWGRFVFLENTAAREEDAKPDKARPCISAGCQANGKYSVFRRSHAESKLNPKCNKGREIFRPCFSFFSEQHEALDSIELAAYANRIRFYVNHPRPLSESYGVWNLIRLHQHHGLTYSHQGLSAQRVLAKNALDLGLFIQSLSESVLRWLR